MLLHCVLNRNFKMKSTNSLQIKSFRCSFFLPIKNILLCLFEVFIANLHSTLTKSKKTGFWADGLKTGFSEGQSPRRGLWEPFGDFDVRRHFMVSRTFWGEHPTLILSYLDISTRKFILWLNVFFQTNIIWQSHTVGMDLNDNWKIIKIGNNLPQRFFALFFH